MPRKKVLFAAFTCLFGMRAFLSVRCACRALRSTGCQSISHLTYMLTSDVLLGGYLQVNLFGAFNVLNKFGAPVSNCLTTYSCFSPMMNFDEYNIHDERYLDVLISS